MQEVSLSTNKNCSHIICTQKMRSELLRTWVTYSTNKWKASLGVAKQVFKEHRLENMWYSIHASNHYWGLVISH